MDRIMCVCHAPFELGTVWRRRARLISQSQSEPSGLRPLLDGLCRCVSMVVIVAHSSARWTPFRGVSSSRWMRLW